MSKPVDKVVRCFAITVRLLAICLLVSASRAAIAQQSQSKSNIQDRYQKQEFQIPMRDGVKLWTAVYTPGDATADKTYPVLMTRTCYSVGPYGEDQYRDSLGPSNHLEQDGYIFVYQDVRGCFMSEGEFVNMTPHQAQKDDSADVDESSDTYDTIQWLLENIPHHNGKVGLWGISYPGFYAAAGMIDAHPALRAVSPQAPIADWWYDDFHHHGAFFLPHAFNFLSAFGQPRPTPTTLRPTRFEHSNRDGYQFFLEVGSLKNINKRYFRDRIPFWNDIIAHPNYDQFWQSRNLLPHLKNVAPAVLIVGGWFDAEDLYGPLQIYREIEKHNPHSQNSLVMGPWNHGGWARSKGDSLGNIDFESPTAEHYRRWIEFEFFHHHLKHDVPPTLPEAYVFETGSNRWRQFDAWPPRSTNTKTLYFSADEVLQDAAPTVDEPVFDEFISDPRHPVPFVESISTGMAAEYMTADQRFAARRPDVLVYHTPPLADDLTLAGPLNVRLFVSTSQSDADWIVKLIDVFPHDARDPDTLAPGQAMGGYQMLVRSEVVRGRFRDDPSLPRSFTPDEVTAVTVPLQDVLHCFRAGHQLMIQVQSTWFPLVDRNPQKYVDNIFLADEADFLPATHRVYRGQPHASHVEMLQLAE